MRCGRRIDPKSIDLTITCTECGYKLAPAEVAWIDSANLRCPQCKAGFDPLAGKNRSRRREADNPSDTPKGHRWPKPTTVGQVRT
jgi:DNA-directed RNA polymerase subunit RPC12/RpoP